MTNILDRVAASLSHFRPETTQEFFALQLARKLKDVASVRSYVALVDRFSEDVLLQVYRKAVNERVGGSLADRFRIELRRLTSKGGP